MTLDFLHRADGVTFYCEFCSLSERFKEWIEKNAICRKCNLPLLGNVNCCKDNNQIFVWVKRHHCEEFCEVHSREIKLARSRNSSKERRIREKSAKGRYLKEDIEAIYILQNGKCFYCKCNLQGKFQKDHITPLSTGGTNWPSNIALACKKCNQKKGNKSLRAFWRIARKIYGDEIITLSQNENKKTYSSKQELTRIRKLD